jgi:ferredoxin--NADP+ reductase/benzoate/toluate 1,2-dioxygenase reductase subunit
MGIVKKNFILEDNTTEIIEVRHLSSSAYVLRFQRKNIQFEAGQYICLGIDNSVYLREYSIYSGEDDDFLEVLIKEVDEGDLSKRFKKCKPGDKIFFDGPFGSFVLDKDDLVNKNYSFIATGTGISPFHSFVKTYPQLKYQLIHGVSFGEDAYEKHHYDANNYFLCTSKDKSGNFHGRATDYIRENLQGKDNLYYLCGNGNMIYDANSILKSQDVPVDNIFFEVYF